jgi:cell division protein ZipA
MPELRWILIACGAALLLGIYFWGRRSSRQAAATEEALFRTPEQSREPHSAYVFRDEPVTEEVEPTVDESSTQFEPIVADRRHRSEDSAVGDSYDADATEEVAPAPAKDGPVKDKPAKDRAKDREVRRSRIEPKFGDEEIVAEQVPQPASQPEEPVREAAAPATAAPTLSMSNTPPPRRSERRKIMALRIAAAPQRYPGDQLLAAMEGEGLQLGKYDVFHRLNEEGSTLFSVASMVEPGTFDPLRMPAESFPGITLFAQFPGPVESMLAFNELVLTARRLHEALGGTLQDERGVPLTIHRLERLRQDIRDFDQNHSSDAGHRTETAPSAAP